MAAGIYVHIPFCKQKCKYCDFTSGVASEARMWEYHEALKIEIQSTDYTLILAQGGADTLFFGGGTPSVYPVNAMEELMKLLKPLLQKDAEITMEVNPGTLTKENLKRYKAMGINRISMGLQSAVNHELEILGRIHTWEQFLESYSLAREVGFDNINIDIISAIPEQTLDSFSKTLNQVVALQPEHISVYSLIVEPGTPFYNLYGEGKTFEHLLPGEEEDRAIYHYTGDFLAEHGYTQYEISNYAKVGAKCKHNLKYWQMEDYFGFGLAAASKVGNQRYTNVDSMQQYLQILNDKEQINISALRQENDCLSREALIEEFMFLGLRMTDGVSNHRFQERFGCSYQDIYQKVIDKFIKEQLLEYSDTGKMLRLTKQGLDVANYVMCEFLLTV